MILIKFYSWGKTKRRVVIYGHWLRAQVIVIRLDYLTLFFNLIDQVTWSRRDLLPLLHDHHSWIECWRFY